jgi:porin
MGGGGEPTDGPGVVGAVSFPSLTAARAVAIAIAIAIAVAAVPGPAYAMDWLDGEDAPGGGGGPRSWLDQRGVHLDLDYSAEAFSLPADQVGAYRGNVDLVVMLDTEKLELWPCGRFMVYGQHAHGRGVSGRLAPIVAVSNLEAEEFTQLSELWLEQCLGPSVTVRLGKQDANRDFAGPRFAGNFINSSYGASPSVPMPSFPAPGVGAALFVAVTDSLGARGGVYEGAPTINSFGQDAVGHGAGTFAVAALVLEHDLLGQPSGLHQFGAWRHTGMGRHGVFGVVDCLMKLRPAEAADSRSVQLFARGAWSEQGPGLVHFYAGGGLTLHGVLGGDNTLGLGTGHARTDDRAEAFIELFFKLRLATWISFEPDAQVYFLEGNQRLALGLRGKIKL